MKIILIGSKGQLGWELKRSLVPLGEVIALDRKQLDITDTDAVRKVIYENKPEIIVNASAYTSVDKAEADPEGAFAVNAEGVSALAHAACECGSLLVHYSTDYVFDGNSVVPYLETTKPNPLSVYGKSKLKGEQLIKESGCKHIIFRTSWVYAAYGNNFAKTILKLAGQRPELSVINDQIGAPASAELIADITLACLFRLKFLPAENVDSFQGIYNLTASGSTSWYGFATFLIEKALEHGYDLLVSPDRIKPIPATDYPLPAKRPYNSMLDTRKIKDNFGVCLPDWQKHVERLIVELKGRI